MKENTEQNTNTEDGKKPRKMNRIGKHKNRKYSDELITTVLDSYEDWIMSGREVIDNEGNVTYKENVHYFEFAKYVYEVFGITLSKLVLAIRVNHRHFYERYQELRELSAYKTSMMAQEGLLKENSAKFMLQAQHRWSEKIETTNTNTNIEINWREEKTYEDSDNQ